MKEEICKLLAIADSTIYKFRKEGRPILALLEKYFTQEDLEEFLEYGTIEKFEFLKTQDYLVKESEFILMLAKLPYLTGNDDYIDYLAYALSYDHDTSEYLKTRHDFFAVIASAYDSYIRLYPNNPNKGLIRSDDLGLILKAINFHFPKQENYVNIISYFIERDFLPFIKACMHCQSQYMNEAIKFCIQFNLHKYNKSVCHYEKLYERFKIPFERITNDHDSALPIVQGHFNFEKFLDEMKNIKKENENNIDFYTKS